MLDIPNVVRWHNSRKGARKITAADVQMQAFSLPYWRMNGKARVQFRYEIGEYSAQAEAAAMQCYQAELAEHAALLSDIRHKIKQNDKAIERGESVLVTSFQKGSLDAQERRARIDRPERPSPESFIEWNWSRPLVTTSRIEMTLPSFVATQLVAGMPASVDAWLQRNAFEAALDMPAVALPEDESLVADSPALKEAGVAAIRNAISERRDEHVRSYEVLDADFVDDGEAFRRYIWVATVRSGKLRTMLLVGRDCEIYGQALAKPISTGQMVMAAIGVVLFAGLAFQKMRGPEDAPVSSAQFAAERRPAKQPQATRPPRGRVVTSSKDAAPATSFPANVMPPAAQEPTAQQQTAAPEQDANVAVDALLKSSQAMDWTSVDQQAAAMKATWVAQPKGNRKLARAANEQGIVQLKLGDFPAASVSFEQGLAADPSDIEIRNNLAFALIHAQQFPKAVNVLAQVLRRVPDRSSAWANLAQALQNLDSADAALRLAVRFSASREKTFAYLQDTARNSDDARFKAVAAKVLGELDSIPRGPDDHGAVAEVPSPTVQVAVTSR